MAEEPYLRAAAKAEEKRGKSIRILRPLGEKPLNWQFLCEWLVE
jgi:hypothetical protein